MEVFIQGIPFQATELIVHEHFEKILHGPPFSDMWKMGYPMNFTIFLHRQNRSHSSGTGVIRIPEGKIALRLIVDSPTLPTLCGARLRMRRSKHSVDHHDIETLRQSPYQDPEILREQNKLDRRLAGPMPLTKLQFGWLTVTGSLAPSGRAHTGTRPRLRG
jgi:hypothetical protein